MAPLIGLICLALGISLAVLWWSPAFLAALELLLVVCLLICGTVILLVGYSAMKAARDFNVAVSGPSTDNSQEEENDVAPIV